MQVLTDKERAHLIGLLADASDVTLLNAVREMNEQREHIQRQARELMTFKERLGKSAEPVPEPVNALEDPPDYKPKKVEVPPGEACTRVGADTKAAIMKALANGPLSNVEINAALKRSLSVLDATTSILKLLWTRGDIVYVDQLYKVKA